MSIKRYNISGLHPHIIENKDGFMVYYEDYARLKADVQTFRHQAVHDVSQLGEQSAEIAHLKAEVERLTNLKAKADQSEAAVERLKAEVERLGAFRTHTIIPNEILQSEVERLQNNCDYLDQKLDEEIDKSAMLCGQVERLTKAGDAMASSIQFNEEMAQDYNGPTIVHQCVQRWEAAKEGESSGCIVNPNKVAQYLPKPPAAKEGKPSV